MNAANLEKSQRLQRVLDLLSDGRPYSTLDIIIGAGVCAVNSCVAELRANGFDIRCRRVGRDRFEYRLLRQEQARDALEDERADR